MHGVHPRFFYSGHGRDLRSANPGAAPSRVRDPSGYFAKLIAHRISDNARLYCVERLREAARDGQNGNRCLKYNGHLGGDKVRNTTSEMYCEPGTWHEAANLFALLPGDELEELASDINVNGLQNEVVLFAGKVLDGRNRFLACKLAGVKPRYREFKPNGICPLTWLISQNLHRRQLTASQKAIIALEAEPMFARELKENQRVGKQRIADPSLKGQARDRAAHVAGVNRQWKFAADVTAAYPIEIL